MVNSSIPNACNQCFQASKECVLLLQMPLAALYLLYPVPSSIHSIHVHHWCTKWFMDSNMWTLPCEGTRSSTKSPTSICKTRDSNNTFMTTREHKETGAISLLWSSYRTPSHLPRDATTHPLTSRSAAQTCPNRKLDCWASNSFFTSKTVGEAPTANFINI